MTLNGIAGRKWFAHQSVLQGCAWSNPLTVVLGTPWACHVENSARVAAYTYADDWYALADRFTVEPEAEPAAANDLPIPAAEPQEAELQDPEPEASPGEPEPDAEPGDSLLPPLQRKKTKK